MLGGVSAATRSPSASPWRPRAARAAYFRGVVPAQLRALALLVRCGESLTPRKRRALRLMLTVDRSPAALAWLILRPLRAAWWRGETLGSEWELLPGVAWSLLARLLARVPRWPERLLLDTRLPDAHFEQRRLRRWRERAARGG